jgi:centromeric protein E
VDESYNTDDTIFEEVETATGPRGREKSMDSKRNSDTAKDSGKGNVIVSVRVRPDSGGGEHNSEDGEWMVDGRRSLISYRGKEGGDHIYGMLRACQLQRQPTNSIRQRFFTTRRQRTCLR